MQLITDQLIESLSVRAGLEDLKNDIELIEQYLTHADGCGLESLDSASGRLIEQGLAVRYPAHFKIGDGLEGIGALLDALKKGVAGFKKLGRGKLKPVLTEQSKKVYDEVKKTYCDQSWIDERKETKGIVSIQPVAKYVGSASDLAGLIANANKLVKTYKDGVTASAKATKDWWSKLAPYEAKGTKADKGSPEAKALLAQLNKAFPIPPHKAIPSSAPDFAVADKDGKLPALSKKEVKQVGDFILSLIDSSNEIWGIAEACRTSCGFDDEMNDNVKDPDLSHALYNLGHWEDLTDPVSEMAETTSKIIFEVAKGFESYIVSSVK